MKKLIAIAIVLTSFGALTANAQGNLKGPKAKNQKAWDNKYVNKADIVGTTLELKGPEAKNQKPEDRKLNNIKMETKGGQRLMGPKAKNIKH